MMFLYTLLSFALADDTKWDRCYPAGVKSEAWCQNISVPVEQGGKEKLNLAVVKLPAIRPKPHPDPLFFLAGGPGQSAIESISAVESSLKSIQKERDIIFIDQRGTGDSNPLSCNFPDVDTESINSDESTEKYLATFKKCIDDWSIEAKHFGTTAAAFDLEAVRKELGLNEINLYGVSYGTRLAQVYMRLFPENTRSAILDGVVPMDVPVGKNVATDAQRVLDLLDDECRNDDECQKLTPSIKGDLETLIDLLDESKPIEAHKPSTGTLSKYRLSPDLVVSSIRLALYTPLLQRMLPYTINQASLGHFEPLIAQTIHPGMKINDVIEEGLYHAIHCSEDYPRLSFEKNEKDGLMHQHVSTDADKVCPLLNVPPPEKDFFEPIQSDVPTLLLSGFRDPITPPQNGVLVSAGLTRNQHIVAAQAAHHVGTMPCAKEILADFVNQPYENTDGSCLEAAPSTPWILSTAGGTP